MSESKATGTEAGVCADIAARQKVGIAKYGITVADNPLTLRQWLQHAYEECLDQAVYLKRAIEAIQGNERELSDCLVTLSEVEKHLEQGACYCGIGLIPDDECPRCRMLDEVRTTICNSKK